MNITTNQLKAFIKVADLRSFTRAAEQLHRTQPGLSSVIHALEDQIGAKLLDRTTRTVTVTEAGAALLPWAIEVVTGASELKTRITAMHLPGKVARFAATRMVVASVFPPVVETLLSANPDLRVEFREASQAEMLSLVKSGQVDGGFSVFGNDELEGFDLTLVHVFGLMLALPRQIGERKRFSGKSVRWADIPDLPILCLSERNFLQRLIDPHLEEAGRASQARILYEGLHAAIAMVAAGQGVSVMPTYAIPECDRQRVPCLPLTAPEVELPWYFVTKKGRPMSPATAVFFETLKEVVPTIVSGKMGRSGSNV